MAEPTKIPAVVFVVSESELTSLQDYRCSQADNTPLTVVRLRVDGAERVVVEGRFGPKIANATVSTLGDASLCPKELDSLSTPVKDGVCASKELKIMRVTLAFDFCDAELLFKTVSTEPNTITAKLLGSTASKVIRTFAACAYRRSVRR